MLWEMVLSKNANLIGMKKTAQKVSSTNLRNRFLCFAKSR